MDEYRLAITSGNRTQTVLCQRGETLLSALQGGGFAPHAPCGGNGKCGKCLVRVSGLCIVSGALTLCEGDEVLACRTCPAGDLTVTVSAPESVPVLQEAPHISSCGTGLGAALDIGTTTLAAAVYDLASGECLGTKGEVNAQCAFGGDVLSRILAASDDEGLEKLSQLVRRQAFSLISSLCEDTGKIKYITVAGNTVMQHIFAGLSPESIGTAPFAPLSLFGTEMPAAGFFEGFAPDCSVYFCPAVSGYVGGDVTAGLLASGAAEIGKTTLFVDIGTNGEMALCADGEILCCAAAAGPAFEGAGMDCGSIALNGAIDFVSPDLSFSVIGGGKARSICGSGALDALSALLQNGFLDESGNLSGGKYAFAPEVFISQSDVRALQLAKAAVAAGIETLLEQGGKTAVEIDEVLIAGGFGAYIRVESAVRIGLLPPEFLGKTRHIGNGALSGAAMALDAKECEKMQKIRQNCRYIELSTSSQFADSFIKSIDFPKKN